jgi:small subunit ribosomal protein S4
MGDPRRIHKRFARPRKMFEKNRIAEENILVKQYGLKNKREIWKIDFKLNNLRTLAKAILSDTSKQKHFLQKMQDYGLNVKTIDEVLGLKKEDLLERRLQTIISKKGIAKTSKQARQLITHKHISVAGRIINIPSYPVPVKLEKDIKIVIEPKKDKKTPKTEEAAKE